jgi:hypothetical protein
MAPELSYEEHSARVAELVAAGELERLARHLAQHLELRSWSGGTPQVLDELTGLPRPGVLRLVRALIAIERAATSWNWYLISLVSALGTRLPAELTDEEAADLLDFAVRRPTALPVARIAALVEWHRRGGPVSPEVRELVQNRATDSKVMRQLATEIVGPDVRPGDPWADQILADLPELDTTWEHIVTHASTALAAKPSGAWTKVATDLLAGLDPEKAHAMLAGWVQAAARTPTRVPDAHNADVLRGLLWTLSLTPMRPETARLLGALTEAMLRRLPGIGPACPKLANAAVGVLARTDGEAALAQLARLSARVTYKGTLNEVNKALDARAAAMGLSRDEVEELAVPTYGLTGVGRLTEQFGGCRAELAVTGSAAGSAAAITWYSEAGKPVKSPPAPVRRDHPDRLAELRSTAKDVTTMLSAQVERIDGLFLARRTWTLATWRERYLNHPLVGTVARRLIWLVDGVPVGYAAGALRAVTDTEVAAPDGATVELWHPIGRPVEEVVGWREWLERHGVVQPFKQAHREVYLLTPAEEATGVYSNRFAAHVLRQHQFHALAAARGWHDKLRLMVDDTYPPTYRELPRWGLRAEYWVEGIGGEYGTDTTEAGSYLRLVTDQVRFYPIDAAENWAHASGGGYTSGRWGRADATDAVPIPLDELPPLVFSEVMRDVDLFVGVASVGNDPTWSDGGPQGRFRDYWTSYSFGELSATAQTRRDLLVRLLPRLAVGSRARVEGRFLVVQGELRTYKIHLGSGNILMSPNDEYLCIVPDRGSGKGTDGLLLPFEGDGVLAVILSKAMLLAHDDRITDPSITRQLRTIRMT